MFRIPIAVQEAMMRLRESGYEAYLVGGCVRDMLMGEVARDWDIATSAEPLETKAVFHDCKVIETGLKHGTVTVLIGGEPIEITTYRMESGYTDNRHPDYVAFTKSLAADVERRDFTINALAYAPSEGLIDDFGGASDIVSGMIRCVGDPDRRFKEDGLRILRALRFSAVLGFEIEGETATALVRNKGLLKYISCERINAELTKMLCGKDVGAVLREYACVISIPIPEIKPMIGFEQHNRHHCYDVWQHTIAVVENSPPSPIARWAALLHDIGKPGCFTLDEKGVGHFYGHAAAGKSIADAVMRRLKFDNATRERVLLLIASHSTPIPAKKKTVKRYLNRMGKEAFSQLLQLRRADNLGKAPVYHYRQADFDRVETVLNQVLEEKSCFALKDLAIKGDDLTALGYRGKEIGRALDLLLAAVIAEKVPNDRDMLLKYLQKIK